MSRNRGGFFFLRTWETVLRFAFFAHVSLLILVNVVVWVIYAMLRRGGTKGKWLQPSQAQGEFAKKKHDLAISGYQKAHLEFEPSLFTGKTGETPHDFFVDKERVQ